jgi:hypothetical protein
VGTRAGLDAVVKRKVPSRRRESNPRTPIVLIGQIKVKFSLCFFVTEHHAMKAYCGNGGISPRILDLGIRWR